MAFRIEDSAKFFREEMEYWRQVEKSEGFDVDGIKMPQGVSGLAPYDCEGQFIRIPFPPLVKRYGILGLHRYNLSKGTNFVLNHIKKFNKSMCCLTSYYITLVACDPATGTLVTMEVGVYEKEYGILNVSCFIARPKGTCTPEKGLPQDAVERLPYWPSDSDFNDTKRFYLVKESELRDNDWISLYLELAICSNDRLLSENDLSQLVIVKVAIETIEDVEPRLEAKIATVYITFKGLAMARTGEIGEHVERKVIVRRVINERTGHLSLLGRYGFPIGEDTKAMRPMTVSSSEWSLGQPRSSDEKPLVTYPGPLNLFLYKKSDRSEV